MADDMTTSGDQLLDFVDLENEYYTEGYEDGMKDGQIAGLVEGKIFGIEKGYEKGVEVGKLRGRAALWSNRRQVDASEPKTSSAGATFPQRQATEARIFHSTAAEDKMVGILRPDLSQLISPLPATTRLSKQIDSLLSTVDPSSLSLENNNDASEDLELKLKRGTSKIKVIANMIGEPVDDEHPGRGRTGDSSGSIEDISSLSVRH